MSDSFFGEGSLKNLETILQDINPDRVLLVTGDKSFESSGSKAKVEEILAGTMHQRYYGFEENPKFPELLEGANKVHNFNPDLIVAIGGGSVLDTAKIISVLPVKKKRPNKLLPVN